MRRPRFFGVPWQLPRHRGTGLLVGLLLVGGCATGARTAAIPQPPLAPAHLEMEPMKIEAKAGPAGIEVASYDAQELFERAGAALSQKRPDEALSLYGKLLETFPESTYARAAAYNRGLAFQDKKDWAGAAETFRAFAEKYSAHADAKDALFQLGASYAELSNWPASGEVFSRLLARTDLTADDRIEALARRAFAQFNQGDLDVAERAFRSVIAYRDQVGSQERLSSDFYIAFSLYHLGQVSHSRFKSVSFRLPEAQMDRDIDDKARLLLEAQRRYIDAIKVGHPGWASAAGFQVGALYEELYDSFVNAPVPANLDAEGRDLYAEELRSKVRVLLEKSLRWYRENLLMMERVGASSEWTEKSKLSYAKLLRLLDPKAPHDAASPSPAPAGPGSPAAPPPRPDLPGREQGPARSDQEPLERQIL